MNKMKHKTKWMRAAMTLLVMMLTTVTAWATDYIDENGQEQSVTATVLTGNETTLEAGWYVVNSNITYDHALQLGDGDVNIILANGKKMSIGTDASPIEGYGIKSNSTDDPALYIYGQTTDTDAAGSMEVYSTHGISNIYYTQHSGNVKSDVTNGNGNAFQVYGFTLNGGSLTVSTANSGVVAGSGGITINGGVLNATTSTTNNSQSAIVSTDDITINGGQVTATATGTGKGIKSNYGDIILGYSKASDFIKASSYLAENTITQGKKVKVKDGLAFLTDDDTPVQVSSTVSDLSLINDKKLKPIVTYYVKFDKNNENVSGTMERQTLTYGEFAELNACTFIYAGHALKEWTTEADGTGKSYYPDWPVFPDLTNVQGATVTLYAQWGKDISTCSAEVPDQTKGTNDYILYKFENANSGSAVIGEEVKDGEKVLKLGTDYKFGTVTYRDGSSGTKYYNNSIGEELRVEIKGIGDYAGTKTADFTIVSETGNGTWGDLAWSIDSDGKLTISKKDGVESNVAMQEPTQGNYPWYSRANNITSITIGEGVSSIAAGAFAGNSNVSVYGNVTSLTLPTTLTTIGENAFAYCTGLGIDLADLTSIDYPANAFSYIGTITGTLYDAADNSKTITMMSQARTSNVTITGRTLWKDGNWNTLCLPFNVKKDDPILDGATIMELDLKGYYTTDGVYYSYDAQNARRTSFDAESGELYLYFKTPTADANDNLLIAGTPYLIKWPSGENITSPLTYNEVKVLISPLLVRSYDGHVYFNGTFSAISYEAEDKSVLLMGVGNNGVNTLYYPSKGSGLGAFRAYFKIENGGNAIKALTMNFGDGETVTAILDVPLNEKGQVRNDGWYDLSGRKLSEKPTAKGMYIHDGRKVMVK